MLSYLGFFTQEYNEEHLQTSLILPLIISSSSLRTLLVLPSLSVHRDSVWTPHVYLVNEQESVVMGSDKKDILLTLEPDGTVALSARSVSRSAFRWFPSSTGKSIKISL